MFLRHMKVHMFQKTFLPKRHFDTKIRFTFKWLSCELVTHNIRLVSRNESHILKWLALSGISGTQEHRSISLPPV